MKKWLYLSLCCIVCSCNKPLPDYANQPFDYSVTGIDDTTVPANGYIMISPDVTLISGNAAANPVTLTFSGIPPGVFLGKNGFSLKLSNNFSDSFGAHNAAQGIYPMQAVFSSPAGTKTYNVNLTVGPPINRTANVIGGFYPSNSCSDEIYVSCEIDSVPGSPGTVMIIDRVSPNEASYGTFDTSYGTVDCCSNSFTIPAQKVQGATVSGYASFNTLEPPYKTGTITRTFVTDTSDYTCTVTLSQN